MRTKDARPDPQGRPQSRKEMPAPWRDREGKNVVACFVAPKGTWSGTFIGPRPLNVRDFKARVLPPMTGRPPNVGRTWTSTEKFISSQQKSPHQFQLWRWPKALTPAKEAEFVPPGELRLFENSRDNKRGDFTPPG